TSVGAPSTSKDVEESSNASKELDTGLPVKDQPEVQPSEDPNQHIYTVYDDGGPDRTWRQRFDASVYWRYESGEKGSKQADEDGKIRFRLNGNALVSFGAPGCRSTQETIYNPTPREITVYLQQEVPDDVVRVQVQRADGTAAVGLPVEIVEGSAGDKPSLGRAACDSRGIAEVHIYGNHGWRDNLNLIVRRMASGFEPSVWITLPVDEEHFNIRVLEVTLPPCVWVQGRVLDPEGQPAAKALVYISDFVETHPKAWSSRWQVDTETNHEGTFAIACDRANSVSADIFWTNEFFTSSAKVTTASVAPNEQGFVDLGTSQVEVSLRLRVKAMLDGKPLRGAHIEMRNTPSVFTGQSTNEKGIMSLSGWPRSKLLALTGTPEVRAYHRLGQSDWVPVLDAMLNRQDVVVTLEPATLGLVKIRCEGHQLETPKQVTVTTFGHGGAKQPQMWRLSPDEDWQIELPEGKYTMLFRDREGRLGNTQVVLVSPEAPTEVLVRLQQPALCHISGLDVASEPSLRASFHFSDGRRFFPTQKSSEGSTREYEIEPDVAFEVRVRLFTEGKEYLRKLSLPALKSGEAHELDVSAEVESMLKEAGRPIGG
ncbi:MAG: hypothetical protein KDB07_04960, partial [Planctomycetes bacterium]|nr:hypothetical protein [Planctomycetota bacterium]